MGKEENVGVWASRRTEGWEMGRRIGGGKKGWEGERWGG